MALAFETCLYKEIGRVLDKELGMLPVVNFGVNRRGGLYVKLCTNQIEASTSPPPRAFYAFSRPGVREFAGSPLIGVGNLIASLDVMLRVA